jgi:hypothetical protein
VSFSWGPTSIAGDHTNGAARERLNGITRDRARLITASQSLSSQRVAPASRGDGHMTVGPRSWRTVFSNRHGSDAFVMVSSRRDAAGGAGAWYRPC